jgi:hypothetical protein
MAEREALDAETSKLAVKEKAFEDRRKKLLEL